MVVLLLTDVLLVMASDSHPDLSRAPDVLYGVKYLDLVSLALFSGRHHGRDRIPQLEDQRLQGRPGVLRKFAGQSDTALIKLKWRNIQH